MQGAGGSWNIVLEACKSRLHLLGGGLGSGKRGFWSEFLQVASRLLWRVVDLGVDSAGLGFQERNYHT